MNVVNTYNFINKKIRTRLIYLQFGINLRSSEMHDRGGRSKSLLYFYFLQFRGAVMEEEGL